MIAGTTYVRTQKIGSRRIVLALFALASLATSGCAIPPQDSNGNLPPDVVREFIGLCEAEDHEGALKLFYVPSELSSSDTRKFEAFCARYRKIGLKNCKISRAVKGKADWWHVEVDFEEGGEQKHVFFYFMRFDGVWKLDQGNAW